MFYHGTWMMVELIAERWSFRETSLLIKADSPRAIEAVKRSILNHRRELERYFLKHPFFGLSLEPLGVEASAPKLVKLMAEAGKLAGVGPMAAVAGALAQLAVEDAVAAGARNVLVDNGGDIFIHGDQSFTVAIYAGGSPLSGKLALELKPEFLPLAVCTSSATVGHSLSFGRADAVTVLAKSGALADAAATAICNQTRGEGEEAIKAGLKLAREMAGLLAVIIILGERVGSWGKTPEIINLKMVG